MINYQNDFTLFKAHTWLNAASEGPLPLVAQQALVEAAGWKSQPYQLTFARFAAVPLALKRCIAELLHVEAHDVILGNSASYGWHVLAQAFPWKAGDEILCMQNDFPTNILPWLTLKDKGVVVKQWAPRALMWQPEELRAALTPQTRAVCLSHVHTFSGIKADVDALSQICQERGVLLFLNVAQSVGSFPVDISVWPGVDAVVAASYKWLCGPYGTGFCWMKPSLRQQLRPTQAYWQSVLNAQDLNSEGPLVLKDTGSARQWDMFGTANFFNYVPLTKSIEYFLKIGLDNVAAHNKILQDYFIQHLDKQFYSLISPIELKQRSGLMVFSHQQPERNQGIFDNLVNRQIYGALWKGKLRVAPHVYNTLDDIKTCLHALHEIAA